MKNRSLFLAALCAVAVFGCTQNITLTGPDVNVSQTGPGPSVSTSPAPGSGTQVVFGEKVGEFGEVCPSGVTPAEQNNRETRVGCNSAVTCSPTDRDGAEIKGAGPSIVQLISFRQLGGAGAGKFEAGDNPYNGHVTCSATGVVVLECSLRDTASGVVTTGGDGGNRAAPWSMNCVG